MLNPSKLKLETIIFEPFFIASLISFTSLIVLLDTFKEPISNYFPDIDLFLNSLYESLKDLSLFIKDLLQ